MSPVDQSIALDPTATLAYTLKYEILTGLGRLEAAGEASRRAVELDALSALVVNNRAVWLQSAGQVDSAIHYSERAVELSPAEPLWRRTLGLLYGLAGRYEDGVRECRAAGLGDSCAATIGLVAGGPNLRDEGLARLGERGRLPRTLGTPTLAAMI